MYPLYPQAVGVQAQGADPGYKALFHFAPLPKFTTLQEAPATGTNPGDTMKIAGNHAFGTDDGFFVFEAYFDEGLKIESKQSGDPGFMTEQYVCEGFIVGDDAVTKERMQALKNRTGIALVGDPDCNADRVQQLGCRCNPAVVSFEFTSGTLKDGRKGFKFMITTRCAPVDYEGTITIADEAA